MFLTGSTPALHQIFFLRESHEGPIFLVIRALRQTITAAVLSTVNMGPSWLLQGWGLFFRNGNNKDRDFGSFQYFSDHMISHGACQKTLLFASHND